MNNPYRVTDQMRRDFGAGVETPEILAVHDELSIEMAEQGLDREMGPSCLDQHREKRLLEIFQAPSMKSHNDIVLLGPGRDNRALTRALLVSAMQAKVMAKWLRSWWRQR